MQGRIASAQYFLANKRLSDSILGKKGAQLYISAAQSSVGRAPRADAPPSDTSQQASSSFADVVDSSLTDSSRTTASQVGGVRANAPQLVSSRNHASQVQSLPEGVSHEDSYSVPVGESGQVQLTATGAHNSFIRLYAFERQHVAAQQDAALNAGVSMPVTDIGFKAMVGPDGFVQAVAAETRTIGDANGNGSAELLDSELAYADHAGVWGLSGRAAFGLNMRAMPIVRTSGSVGAVQRMMDQRSAILSATSKQDLPGLLRSLSDKEVTRVMEAFRPIVKAFDAFRGELDALQSEYAFSGVRVASDTDTISASIQSEEVAPQTHTVEVSQLATAQVVESARVFSGDDAVSALGLSGSFSMNGTRVDVDAQDTMVDLVAHINEAMDASSEGALSVVAQLQNGRLRLTSAQTGPQEMDFVDPDRILESLQILSRDVQDQVTVAREVQASSAANIVFDGENMSSHDNTFDVAGLQLTVQATTDGAATLSVTSDEEGFVAATKRLVDGFNEAMSRLNQAVTLRGGALRGQEGVNRSRVNLRNAGRDDVADREASMRNPSQAGVFPVSGQQTMFNALQLEKAVMDLRDIIHGTSFQLEPLQQATGIATVTNALDSFGVLADENDTLRLDADALQKAMASDFSAVRELFSGADGYVARMRETVDRIARDPGGTLDFAQKRLRAYEEVFSEKEVRSGIRALQAADQARLMQGMLISLSA